MYSIGKYNKMVATTDITCWVIIMEHTRALAHTHTHAYTRTHMYTHTHTHTHTHTLSHTHAHTHTHTLLPRKPAEPFISQIMVKWFSEAADTCDTCTLSWQQ